MKITAAITIFLFALSFGAFAKEEKTNRAPSQSAFTGQVQFCEGTEALGNEGQGMGAGGFINISTDPANSNVKKCDLAMTFAYEYGNDRGLKIGRFQSYSLIPIPTGKTECAVKEENGEVTLTVRKAAPVNSRSKKASKILIESCKMTIDGN